MRMPQIQQTGVPSAESVSAGQIISGAQANVNLGSSLVRLVSDYKSQMNKIEAATQFNHHYNNTLLELDEAYAGYLEQPLYDSAGNSTYSTLDSGWKSVMEKRVKASIDQMSSPAARAKFQDEMGTYMRAKMIDVRGVQRDRQVSDSLGKLESRLIQYKSDPDGAIKGANDIGEAVALGLIKADDGVKRTSKYFNEHQISYLNTEIEKASDDIALDGLRDMLLNDPSEFLSAADVSGLLTSIDSRETYLDKQEDDLHESNHVKLSVQALNGDLTLDGAEAALAENKIKPRQYDDLVKRINQGVTGVEVDNWEQLVEIKTNLENVSELEILGNESLTRQTRLALITERKSLIKEIEATGDKSANWTRTQEGRRAFKILNSIKLDSMRSTMDGMLYSVSEEVFELEEQLFNELEKLPISERKGKAVESAWTIVNKFKENEAIEKKKPSIAKWLDVLDDVDSSQWSKVILQNDAMGSPPKEISDLKTNSDLEALAKQYGIEL